MPKVSILWPKADADLMLDLLVASGVAHKSIATVLGECTPMSPDGQSIKGETIAYYLEGGRPGRARSYRWMIIFRIRDEGSYRLSVTGINRDLSKEQPLYRNFTHHGSYGSTITSHQNNEDITNEADDFVPYGNLTANPLGDVNLKYEDSSGEIVRIDPIYTFSDCTDLEFWSAQFPSLSQEVYALHVEDSMNQGDTITGLTVNQYLHRQHFAQAVQGENAGYQGDRKSRSEDHHESGHLAGVGVRSH